MEEQTLPPVFFNHLYIVLDDKTYRAIQGSDFLQIAFPGKEKRATLTAAGETWSGTYFYCQDNYLEFFGSGNGPVTGKASRGGHWQTGAQEGWAGLAFSTDQAGGVNAVRETLHRALGFEPFHELRQMRAGEQSINWFYQVKLAEQLGLGSFESWVMEYHPEVFAYKGLSPSPGGELSRQAYLSPWNKGRASGKEYEPGKENAVSPAPVPPKDETISPSIPNAPKNESGSRTPARNAPRVLTLRPESPVPPVFSRVIGATLHLDARRAERFARILNLLGYTKTGDDHQGKGIGSSPSNSPSAGLALSAHGFTLTIKPEEEGPEGYRLSSVRLAMSRPSVAPMTFVFAPGSRLVLNDDQTADWEFGL